MFRLRFKLSVHRKTWLTVVGIVCLILSASMFMQPQIPLPNHVIRFERIQEYAGNKTFSFKQNQVKYSKRHQSVLSKWTDTSGFRIMRPVARYGDLVKHHLPDANLTDKYIIYNCNYLCGGLADRQKGIVTAYVLSQLLRRRFGLIMKGKCDFSNYVIPNEVNWLVNDTMLRGKTWDFVINIDDTKLGQQMQERDLGNMFDKDVTYYQGNIDFVPYLMRKKSFSTISWARNKTHYEIYRTVFAQLFKFSPNTQRRYEDFYSQTKHGNLVCAHLRMGQSKTLPSDADFTHKRPDPATLLSFLKRKMSDSSKLFIATDSEDVRKWFRKVFPEQFIEIKGDIVHIDRSGPNMNCFGMEKAILDQFILSTCDMLVMSVSGFSRIAAILRGSDENLYLAKLTNISTITYMVPP